MKLLAQRVYWLVSRIPAGRVATYSQIAGQLGQPKLSRAVGQALKANRSFYTLKRQGQVPCHRVVWFDGSVGGFNQGAAVKIKLLRREGVKLVRGRIDLNQYLWVK